MIDLGRKSGIVTIGEQSKDNKKYYPSMCVPLEIVKGKSVGDMCRFEVVVKVVGMSEREDQSEANLEVRKARYIGKAGKATKDEYTNMSDSEREAHDKRVMDETSEDEDDDE